MAGYEYCLPQTRTGKVTRPSERARWIEEKGLMRRLADDLAYDENATADVLTAIPTPWARPVLFAQALVDYKTETNPGHPLNPEVTDEWRGLLALFCLGEQFGVGRLDKKRLVISDDDQAPQAARSLTRLRPEPADAWKKFFLIYANDRLIACTSPLSLFFTPRDYDAPVPWRNHSTRRLIDPIKYFRENGGSNHWHYQIAALAVWAEEAHAALSEMHLPADDKNDSYRDKLLTVLKKWHDDLKRELGWTADSAIAAAKSCDTSSPLIEDAPYSSFTKGRKSAAAGRGDFLLNTGNWRDKPEAPIVLYSKIWESAESRRVYDVHVVREVSPPSGAQGVKLLTKDGAVILHPWVYAERAFFTDKVLRLGKEIAPSENALFANDTGLLLPLRKEVLNYFTPEEIKKYTKCTPQADGGVEVRLEIPVQGSIDKIRVSRRYRQQDIVEFNKLFADQEIDPVRRFETKIAVWPDFVDTKKGDEDYWQHYYAYVRQWLKGLSIEPVLFDRKDERSGGTLFYSVEPIYAFECTLDPLVINLEGISDEMLRITGDERRLPAGMIIADPEKFQKPQSANATWDVSVDFGTSNTSLGYRTAPDAASNALVIRNRCLLLLKTPDPDMTKDELIIWFQPTTPLDSGISSSTCARYRAVENPEAVFDAAHLYLNRHFHWYSQIHTDTPLVLSNLKWTLDVENRKIISAFLSHLLLLVAAEAKAGGAAGVRIHWSYPSTFQDWMHNDMTAKWTDVINKCKGTGLSLQLQSDRTEAEAVCRYFRDKRQARLGGNALITIDVGGGTSDMAVWHGGKMKMQTSLRLSAGVVAEYCTYNKKAFDAFVRAAGHEQYQTDYDAIWRHENKQQHIPTTLNLLCRTQGEKIISGIYTEGVSGPLLKARSLILLSFGGILHYLGLCLRRLFSDSNQQVTAELWFAGNGSNMLHWLGAQDKFMETLAAILKDAAKPLQFGSLVIDFSEAPKQEVVQGLVSHSVVPLEERVAPTSIAGEKGYRLGELDMPWDYDMNTPAGQEAIKSGQLSVPQTFPELISFLNSYDREAAKFGLLQLAEKVQGQQPRIRDAMIDKLRTAQVAAADKQRSVTLNPLFIEEVRAVMEEFLLGIKAEAVA